MTFQELVNKISDKYKIKIYQVESGDKFCIANGEDNYINSSSCAGSIHTLCESGAEIWVGIYDDEELKTIGFLHEVGHCIHTCEDDLSYYDNEKRCWNIAYWLGKKYGVKFSKQAIEYAEKSLKSYDKEEYKK